MEDEIQVFTPPVADQAKQLDGALVTLTEQIAKIAPDTVSSGFLGGTFGYGAAFENEVFLMHPYCWCEKEGECPWCTGCGVYREDGTLATSENGCKWCAARIGDKKVWAEAWETLGDVPHPDQCPYQTGSGIFSKFAPVQHIRARLYYDPPNFWHKRTNFRVTWYKWIGRDMATNGVATDLQEIFNECLASLTPPRNRHA